MHGHALVDKNFGPIRIFMKTIVILFIFMKIH